MQNARSSLLTIATAIGMSFCITSCDQKEEPEPTQTIWEIVSGNPALSQLSEALDSVDLETTLSSDGKFTLFAPNNKAFDELLSMPGFPQSFHSINKDVISEILLYQLVDGEYLFGDLTNNLEISSKNEGNDKIKIIVNDGVISLRTASNQNIEIITFDIRASNGTIHIIESVLIPSAGDQIFKTNASTLLLGASFSTLASGIAKADAYASENNLTTLLSILAGSNHHTVFAPTNEAFSSANIDAGSFSGAQWYKNILNHIVSEITLQSELITCAQFSTQASTESTPQKLIIFNNTSRLPAQNGLGIYIDSNQDVICDESDNEASLDLLDAEIMVFNAAENTNGNVHVISGILIPKE